MCILPVSLSDVTPNKCTRLGCLNSLQGNEKGSLLKSNVTCAASRNAQAFIRNAPRI